MQVSISVFKEKKFELPNQLSFIVDISLLGGFIGLVGVLAIICHHVH
jgi:hypothetical protein